MFYVSELNKNPLARGFERYNTKTQCYSVTNINKTCWYVHAGLFSARMPSARSGSGSMQRSCPMAPSFPMMEMGWPAFQPF